MTGLPDASGERSIVLRGALAMCGAIIVGLTLVTWVSPTEGHERARPIQYIAQLVFGSSFLVQFRATQRGSSPWMAASFGLMAIGLLMVWAISQGIL